jgi:hypothetical protein
MVGLFVSSIADFLLIWPQNDGAFGVGALFYIFSYLFFVLAFVFMTEEAINEGVDTRKVVGATPVYFALWMVLMTFTFVSINTIIKHLAPGEAGVIEFLLDLYGSVIALIVAGGFFIFFAGMSASPQMYWSSLFFMIASLCFYASDNFLLHGRYDTWYMDRVSQTGNSFLVMIPHYAGQFLLGKGAFYAASHFSRAQYEHKNDGVKNNDTGSEYRVESKA